MGLRAPGQVDRSPNRDPGWHERRARWARILDRCLEEAGESEVAVAAQIGCSRTTLRAFRGLTDGRPKSIDVADVERLPTFARRRLLEELCAVDGLGVVELPAADDIASDIGTLGRLAKESGDVLAAFGASISDGVLLAQEARDTRAEIRELIALLLGLDQRLALVERERVDGIRGLP